MKGNMESERIKAIWIKYFDLPLAEESIYQRDVYAENALDFIADLADDYGLYQDEE